MGKLKMSMRYSEGEDYRKARKVFGTKNREGSTGDARAVHVTRVKRIGDDVGQNEHRTESRLGQRHNEDGRQSSCALNSWAPCLDPFVPPYERYGGTTCSIFSTPEWKPALPRR